MAQNTLKFDNLSELVEEIDKWIDLLNKKKKAILDKIDLEVIKMAFPNNEWKRPTDGDGKSFKYISNDEDNRDKFTSYTTLISKVGKEILDKQAKLSHESISSLIKDHYFMNFVNNEEYKSEFAKNLLALEEIKDKTEATKENGFSVALALNVNDSDKLEMVAKTLQVPPRNLVKYFTNMVIYDYLTHKKIQDKYIEEDHDIDYKRCKSTNVAAFGYRAKTKTLYVIFRGGRKYKYDNVPLKVYEQFVLADSKGIFVNKNLINKYPYKKIN